MEFEEIKNLIDDTLQIMIKWDKKLFEQQDFFEYIRFRNSLVSRFENEFKERSEKERNGG